MNTSLLRDTQYIQKIAQQVNVRINEEGCKLIAGEIENTLRLVIQNAQKYMKHFQRDQMKIDDVTHAIKDLHFIDNVYGYEDNNPIEYQKELDVWIMKPKIVPLTDALKHEVFNIRPNVPPTMKINWMAINGVIPKIRENQNLVCMKENELNKTKSSQIQNVEKVQKLTNLLIKEKTDNFLPKELQLFLNGVIEIIQQEENRIDMNTVGKSYKPSDQFKKMLKTLKENPGLSNVLPLLTNYIYSQHDATVLNGILKKTNLVKVILAFSQNTNFNIEYTLHIQIKILLTIVTSNKLSLNITNNDIEAELHMRDLAAKALIILVNRYEEKYYNLRYNIAMTLGDIFDQSQTNYSTLFGIIRVFFYFDAVIIKEYFLNKLQQNLQVSDLLRDARDPKLLSQDIEVLSNQPETEIDFIKYTTAQRVYSALLELCIKVMNNMPAQKLKGVKYPINLYEYLSDLFGEAALLATSTKGRKSGNLNLLADDSNSRLIQYGHLGILL